MSLCAGLAVSLAGARAAVVYTGVNLAGAEFTESVLPGTYGIHYTYPTADEIDYYRGKGMNTFRIPFRWERLQPTLLGGLDAAELARLDAVVSYATAAGANVILDVHNYGAFDGEVIGAPGSTTSIAAFSDLWRQLAERYAGNDRVIFGLMNEPVGIDNGGGRPGGTTETWLLAANSAITSIRGAGATNLVLVPGNGYTGAWSWSADFYGTPNATVMTGIVDPANNFAYEVHQYFDLDRAGDSTEVESVTAGEELLEGFTTWLRQNNARGFLAEFGVASDATSLAALDNLLDHVDDNSDVWLGWTYWAGGPWWGDYAFSVEPDANGDRPQMAVLEQHAAVPEPGTWAMVAVALLFLFGRRAIPRSTLEL